MLWNNGSRGDFDQFEQQIAFVRHQANKLYQTLQNSRYISTELIISALTQVQLSLEELQVAQEELQQQQEAFETVNYHYIKEQNRYQQLLDFIAEGYLFTDVNGIILEANHAAALLLQYSEERLIGKPLAVFIPLEKRKQFRYQLHNLSQQIGSIDWEMQLQPRKSSLIHVKLKVQASQNLQQAGLCWLVREDSSKQQSLNQQGVDQQGVDQQGIDQQQIGPMLQQIQEQLEQQVQERTGQLLEINTQLLQEIQEHKQAERLLLQQAERERLVESIAYRIRQSLDLDEILTTTVTEVRKFLQTDRVIIYRFKPDWSGVVTVESVALGWMPILYTTIDDPCFRTAYVSQYQKGRVGAIEDIHNPSLPDCYREMLANHQVRANLVVPILQDDKLWGLLIAHQCRSARQWAQADISLLRQLSTRIAIAIQQSELYQQMQHLAIVDGLTQLANRRRFDDYLKESWGYLKREQLPLSLILFDVDFFKKYNDTYGHQAGDECLRTVARVLGNRIKRAADLVARYGGEEFAVILPNTSLEGALQQAEAICETVRALNIPHSSSPVRYLTVSVGVASVVPDDAGSPTSLIAAADHALYQAKMNGRNRVVLMASRRQEAK